MSSLRSVLANTATMGTANRRSPQGWPGERGSERWTSLMLSTARVAMVAGSLFAFSGYAAADGIPVTAYDIHVRLNPGTHELQGEARVTLHREASPAPTGDAVALDFALNRALKIARLTADGATVREHTLRDPPATQPGGEPDTSSLLVIHHVVLAAPRGDFSLMFEYAGALVQDVQAGEKPGQIHNLLMAAHIGDEGIYLDGSGGWYPFVHRAPDATTVPVLAEYRLTADPVEGMKLVAGAAFDAAASEKTGRLTWHSRYPLDSLVLVGGRHAVKEAQAGGIRLALHYTPPKDEESRATIEKHTDLFLEAAVKYLTIYPPLVGPFPCDQFRIVENFFSSGFAFPEFTLLNKALWQMGPRALGHGYLDHEMLHSWWGNSIYVDPTDGNWCEGLASYGANYYGYILDQDEQGARNQRRNYCMSLSALKPEDDKPLGTFGRPDGAGRDIGYGKGAMVFHLVAREIGQDQFWAAMQRLTREYTGKYVNWRTLQTLFEAQSGRKLDRFFEQWVRGAGTPQLTIAGARWQAAEGVLEVVLEQAGTAFELAVPVRIVQADGSSKEIALAIEGPRTVAHLTFDSPPKSVLLDPDYQILRKLEPREIMPTSKLTLGDRKLLVVTLGSELSKFYQRVVDVFAGDESAKEVRRRGAADVKAEELAQSSVLILGAAVRSPAVAALLERTDCPIRWSGSGFRIGDTEYNDPGHAVLCTVHHPDRPESGVTVYYGNSEVALGRSDLLLFYRNSLVVFETVAKDVDGQPSYDARVIGRRDLESPLSIEVRP